MIREATTETEAKRVPPAARGNRVTILIVEDKESLRLVLRLRSAISISMPGPVKLPRISVTRPTASLCAPGWVVSSTVTT